MSLHSEHRKNIKVILTVILFVVLCLVLCVGIYWDETWHEVPPVENFKDNRVSFDVLAIAAQQHFLDDPDAHYLGTSWDADAKEHHLFKVVSDALVTEEITETEEESQALQEVIHCYSEWDIIKFDGMFVSFYPESFRYALIYSPTGRRPTVDWTSSKTGVWTKKIAENWYQAVLRK